MNDRVDILFHLYEEAMAHVRHLEEQRSEFASVLLAVAGGVVAFGLSDGKLHAEYYPGLLLSGIGLFGLLLSWKQNEKINYHTRVAIRHRELIVQSPEVAADNLELIRTLEGNESGRRFFLVSVVPVGLFWSLLYAMILGFGVFVTMQSPKEANKAPEPTPGSVTLRASERLTEMKRRNADLHVARSAPAPGVAHL